MLELLLLRHAKSSWDVSGVDDHDRELAPRGTKAARKVGKLLRDQALAPDLVLTSTAMRTRQTTALVTAPLQPAPPVRELRTLYLAAPGRMLDIVRGQEGGIHRLMLVGHNPGIHALALRLCGSAAPADRSRLEAKFPTAALAVLQFATATWSEVVEAGGRLVAYHQPRGNDD